MGKVDIASRVGTAIRDERRKARLTQETLAHEAGISTTYLGQIERGLRAPTVTVLAAIADALALPTSELLRRAERVS